jgi:hypothetical protein
MTNDKRSRANRQSIKVSIQRIRIVILKRSESSGCVEMDLHEFTDGSLCFLHCEGVCMLIGSNVSCNVIGEVVSGTDVV